MIIMSVDGKRTVRTVESSKKKGIIWKKIPKKKILKKIFNAFN